MLTRIKRKLKFIKRNNINPTSFHFKRNKKKTPSQELSDLVTKMNVPMKKMSGVEFIKFYDETYRDY